MKAYEMLFEGRDFETHYIVIVPGQVFAQLEDELIIHNPELRTCTAYSTIPKEEIATRVRMLSGCRPASQSSYWRKLKDMRPDEEDPRAPEYYYVIEVDPKHIDEVRSLFKNQF